MSTLCQGYVEGSGPCRRWLPLFDVKHIFYILLIKSESMSTLCQWSMSMLTLCQGRNVYDDGRYVKGVGPCLRYANGMSREKVHVDVGYHFLM